MIWIIKVLWQGCWFLVKAFFCLFVLLFMTIMVGCSVL
jgi:hypothetical protein